MSAARREETADKLLSMSTDFVIAVIGGKQDELEARMRLKQAIVNALSDEFERGGREAVDYVIFRER